MANDVTVTFGAKIDELTKAVDGVKQQLGSIEQHTTNLGSAFLKLGALVGVAFTLGGLNEFARKMADSGLEAERTAAMLGITAWQVGQLSSLAKLTGTSLDSLVVSIERMSLNVQHATRDALGPQAQALKVLGLNTRDLIGLKGDEFFYKMAEAVGKFNPSLNLTNALMQIGGRNIGQMVPLLLQGAEWLRRFQEAAAQTKIGTQGFAEAASDTHVRLTLLDMATSGLQKQLYLQLKPALDTVTDQMRKFVMEIRNSIADGGTWYYVVQSIAEVLKALSVAGAGVAFMFRFLSAEAKAFWNNTGTNADEVKAQLVKDLDEMSKKFKETFDGLYGNKSKTSITAGGRLDAGAIEDARNQVEILKSIIDQQAAIEKTTFENRKTLLDADVATYKRTQLQKLDAARELDFQIYSIEYNAQTAKMLLYAQGTKEYEEEQKKLVLLAQKYQQQIVRDSVARTQQVASEWKGVFDTLQTSVNGQLRGLLEGTTTWSQAFLNIMEDLAIKTIEKLMEIYIWQKLVGIATGTGVGPSELFNLTSILPSFAVGTPYISRDGPAVLHKGEMVIPADFSEAIRQGTAQLGSGGGSTTIAVQAWDGASVSAWLRGGGARMLARSLSDHWQTSPGDRPQY